MSTFIGANDCHIVLSMNSFGAIIMLSSKAKLGWPPLKRLGWSNQVARIRFVYQPDCQNLCTKDYKGTKLTPSQIVIIKSRSILAEKSLIQRYQSYWVVPVLRRFLSKTL